jgi:hypothetical protein
MPVALRSKGQQIGDKGEKLFAYLVASDGGWIARKLQDDFGVDFELELTKPEIAGHLLRVQVRATTEENRQNETMHAQISTALLRYAESCRYPVILVLLNLTSKQSRYLWLQEWLLQKRMRARDLKQLSVSVDIPKANDLESGLKHRLRTIARWQTGLQVTLSLVDCARVAAFSGNTKILATVAKLVQDSAYMLDSGELKLIIQEIIKMGESSWKSHDGWELSQTLFAFCREAGTLFAAKDIKRLVIRKSTYSRTGISALGVLYDNFPEYIRSLHLPTYFDKSQHWSLSYYCQLREKYLGRGTIDFAFDPATDFTIGDITLSVDDRSEWLDKWANRGESFILERVRRIATVKSAG